MASFTVEDVHRALDMKSENLGPDDFARIAENRQAVMAKLADMPSSLSRAIDQAKLLLELVVAHQDGSFAAPPSALAQAAGALIYLASPVDLVPDHIEGEGYLDDAAVVELAVERIGDVLSAFCETKGYDSSRYV